MKIAFIGGGNMGEAILAAVVSKGLSSPREVSVSDVSEARRKYLQERFGVTVTPDNRSAITNAEIIILAIKPQTLSAILSELNKHLKPEQLVLSIIAGAKLNTLIKGLSHQKVVRSMPNTPAQIGEGITVWTATPEVTESQKKQAKAILGVMGQEIYVDNEKFMDMATAVSGSGPAYVYYFVEAFIEAAVKIGLPRDVAGRLAVQTLVGATHLLQKSDKKPAELRKAVTSPGGTTAAAIERLGKGDFAGLIAQAVDAAYQRAKELGK
jgi:pyrroline-5-carboxylate reductase